MTGETASQDASGIDFPLLSDEPASLDLLGFDAVADTVLGALLNDELDHVAIGVSGAWGSGKTTVLDLIAKSIEDSNRAACGEDSYKYPTLVVQTQPWRYDPAVGTKETLIAEVLGALEAALKGAQGPTAKVLNRLRALSQQVNWVQALRLTLKSGLTLQLPKPEDLLSLINPGETQGQAGGIGLADFRRDFSKLLGELKDLRRVVVLVDDLDRCLPETVVETLEAIRLFLSTEKMAFVLAADEHRVWEAIRVHLKMDPSTGSPQAKQTGSREDEADLYLHKIVQTTVPVPGLSRFDTEAYLFLLLCQPPKTKASEFEELRLGVGELRRSVQSLDELTSSALSRLAGERDVARHLTPALYEEFRGNPRRVKRFLNDLSVRISIAGRRGIQLSSNAVAKLMVLERLLPTEFERVLEWLGSDTLEDNLSALAEAASPSIPSKPAKSGGRVVEAASSDLGADLVEWAKLPPVLRAQDISSYLHLAASIAGKVVQVGLPLELQPLYADLTSTDSGLQRQKDSLKELSPTHRALVLRQIGRDLKAGSATQTRLVAALLQIGAAHPQVVGEIDTVLKQIPIADVKPATVLRVQALPAARLDGILKLWETSSDPKVQEAIRGVRDGKANGHK